jgi:TolA-binding protein
MKHIKINIDDITEFDLNLAKSDSAISCVNEIVQLSLEERKQRLNNLKKKIQEGTANLFEEKVLAKLLEHRMAERIKLIHRNLPQIEREFKKRKTSPASPAKHSPSPPPPPTQAARPAEYRSELLEFLASQKPPALPKTRPSGKQKSSAIVPSDTDKQPSKHISIKDVFVGIVLLFGLALGLWYTLSPEKPPPPITTFDQQTAGESSEPGFSKETLQEIQTQFDDAMQKLRFGEFEQGKTELLNVVQIHPNTSQAENAYIAIADTYRQRQNNPDEALRYYQMFTEKYPESSRIGLVQLKMGFSYEDMEDTGSAEEMYRLILNRFGEKSRLGQLAKERLRSLQAQ